MDILVIGGSGTMGEPLVQILSSVPQNNVTVIARRMPRYEGSENIEFKLGDAFNIDFFKTVLENHYDAIVDFMWYDENSFTKSLPYLLDATEQYVSLSSAAVYTDSEKLIDETTPRLLDVDAKEMSDNSREYHYIKARTEDILKKNGTKNNWTIVRPHVTFGIDHIPLCTWETNVWLQRTLLGLPIAIPKDVLSKKTTYTHGAQVAAQISKLIGKKEALGEVVQLGDDTVYTWGDVLRICSDVLFQNGTPMNVIYCTSNDISRYIPYMKNRFIYDRLLNRTFNTSKYKSISQDTNEYETLEISLRESINKALKANNIGNRNIGVMYALHDRSINYWTPLTLFTKKEKILYLTLRLGVPLNVFNQIRNRLGKIKAVLHKR